MTIEHGIGAATAEITIYPTRIRSGNAVGKAIVSDQTGAMVQAQEIQAKPDAVLDWRDRTVARAKALGVSVTVTYATDYSFGGTAL